MSTSRWMEVEVDVQETVTVDIDLEDIKDYVLDYAEENWEEFSNFTEIEKVLQFLKEKKREEPGMFIIYADKVKEILDSP